MSEAVRGKGSKFYMGQDDTTELTSSDYITRVKNIGAFSSEYNLIDVEAELDAEYEEKMPGLKKAVAISLSGNFRVGADENKGYKAVLAAHQSQARVKFGIVRPSGLNGIGGLCYINKCEISEATNEGVMTWTAEATTTGPISSFTEPIESVE